MWRDNWLPRFPSPKITTKKNKTRLKWVSDLFLGGTRKWDENLIRYLFYPHDAAKILNLLIQASGEGDFIAWHFEKNGMFFVKSV